MGNLSKEAVGTICVIVAVIFFSIQDMAFKWMSGDYPLHQIVMIRATIAIVLTVAIIVPLEGGIRILQTKRLGMQLLRGGALVIGNLTFFVSLASLQLPTAVATFFTAPLIITLLAVVFLGERLNAVRVALILMGFCGVLFIVRPSAAGLQIAAILPLVAAFAYSCMQLLTRRLADTEPAAALAFYVHLMFILSSLVMAAIAGNGRFDVFDNPSASFLLRAWSWPTTQDWAIIAALGVLNTLAGYLIGQGYRLAEAGRVAPFEYVAVPMSVLWGALIWSDWPDAYAWVGIVMIVGAGLAIARSKPVQSPEVKL
ncbi:MAG: EamA family transporter [Boseongicola sp.]|nr:MAG: EamA family transporter [Boseongicola sp.]